MGLPFSLRRAEQAAVDWTGKARRDETRRVSKEYWSRGLGLFASRVRCLIVDTKNVYSEKV